MSDEKKPETHADPAAAPAPAKEEAPKKEGGDSKKDNKKEKKKGGSAAVDPKTHKGPDFWEDRIAKFEALYNKQEEEYKAKEEDITVTLLDGKELKGRSWKTTPEDIARELSSQLPDKMFCAMVNGTAWDMGRPLEGSCDIEFLDWENEESQKIFWHSSAHILGAGMEWLYQAKLSTGPPLPEGGFFYEADTDRPVSETEYKALETLIKDVIKGKHKFQRLVLAKKDALELFKYNQFKHATLSDKVPENGFCTVYRCGPLIDPCRGPHIPHTGRVKAFQVWKNSSSYWRGKDTNPVLQRIYGIAFPQEKLLKEWQQQMRDAEENNHRNIGVKYGLWMFHDHSPGSAFWFPTGARIYNTLIDTMRKFYRKKGFEEVITPNMYNSVLWKTSGHWQKYQDDMFQIKEDSSNTFALKPMNCPGHCLMYAEKRRSFKELPIRYGDFGVLHRNELQGALSGLTRVRRFQQDDGHIFCLPEQTESEIEKALHFLQEIYDIMGFKFNLALSTRPETMLGTHEMWDRAESALANALNKFCNIPTEIDDPFSAGKKFSFTGYPDSVRRLKAHMKNCEKNKVEHGIRHVWAVNEGDGAFYGPKIDIRIEDCIRRKHQLGTLQLDFNLPQRFNLVYEPSVKPEVKQLDEETLVLKTGELFKPTEEDSKVDKMGNKAEDCLTGAAAQKAFENNHKRPVLIHRAILGSFERCIAILCEHWKGKWPFWISPKQIQVIPIATEYMDYAREVKDMFYGEGFQASADLGGDSLDKKVRNAQVNQYNFILVVGENERKNRTANVRTRDNQRHGEKSLDELLEMFRKISNSYDSSK